MNLYAHIFPATDDGVAAQLENLFDRSNGMQMARLGEAGAREVADPHVW